MVNELLRGYDDIFSFKRVYWPKVNKKLCIAIVFACMIGMGLIFLVLSTTHIGIAWSIFGALYIGALSSYIIMLTFVVKQIKVINKKLYKTDDNYKV